MTNQSKMLILGQVQKQNRLTSLVKSFTYVCGNGVRNKNFSLVFTSVVLSQKHGKLISHGKLNSHSNRKVWENTSTPKLWVSYIFHVRY